jgi:hypothetical protein
MSEFVKTHATQALEGADEDAISAFLEAAGESAWLDESTLQILRVRSAVARRRLLGAAAPPLDDSVLESLVAAQTDAADEAVSDWITGLAPPPAKVFKTLETRTHGGAQPPAVLRRAIATASANWSSDEKTDLLDAIGPRFVKGELDGSVVEAAGLADTDPERAANALIAAYGDAGNNDERKAAMKLWQYVNPSPEEARRKLINRIYLPLLKTGKGAAEIGLAYFGLVRDAPQTMRDKIKKALSDAAAGDEALAKRASKLMQDAGWIPRKKGETWVKRTLRKFPRP